ncbi:MAG: biotin--[acetyl-CoA-carboxylase] ligase [Candidatus Cloacimonadales bacterium]
MKIDEHPLFDEIIYKTKINSTSTYALSLIKDKLVKGNFLVVADEQSSGKGKLTNSWYSPQGGLWFSIGLYNVVQDSSITLFMATLIHQTLTEIYPSLTDVLKIKWPNDIFLEDKKMCGILTSYYSWSKYLICGIGIDTNIAELPLELLNIATSLRDYLQVEVSNSFLLKSLLDKLHDNLPIFVEKGFAAYQDYYNKYDYLQGRFIGLDTEFQVFRGRALKVNKKGALILEIDENIIQPFYSGSVVEIE